MYFQRLKHDNFNYCTSSIVQSPQTDVCLGICKLKRLLRLDIRKLIVNNLNTFRVMKNFLSGISIVLSATIAFPAAAEVTPNNLIFQGYRGQLKSEGIPSYAAFRQAVFLGKVDAETLVKGAIAQGKLEPTAANDKSYLNEVRSSLSLLKVNGNGR